MILPDEEAKRLSKARSLMSGVIGELTVKRPDLAKQLRDARQLIMDVMATVPGKSAYPMHEDCDNCGKSDADCYKMVMKHGKACCARCYYTDTHNNIDPKDR